MKKLTIPAILAATVMVAGAFAFMPVQDASTVHTTIQSDTKVITANVSLDGWVGSTDAKIPIIDTTNVNNIEKGHIVLTLPIADNDTTCGEGNDAPLSTIAIIIGAVDNSGGNNDIDTDELNAADNTGVKAGEVDIDKDGQNQALCVFHIDFSESSVSASKITDIVIQYTGSNPLPDNAAVSATVKLNNDVSTDA